MGGYSEGGENPTRGAYENGKLAGIREVVEFALKYMNDVWGYDYSGKRVGKAKLYAKGGRKKCRHRDIRVRTSIAPFAERM